MSRTPIRILALATLIGCAALAAIVVAAGQHAGAPVTPVVGPAAGAVVTIDWLAAHLEDPGVAIISADDARDFESAHIPGAQAVGHMATADSGHGLLTPERLAAVFAEAGVSDTTRVVIYGDEPLATGWLYMALSAIGHADHVSMLSGHVGAWRAAGHAIETGSPKRVRRGALTIKAAPDVTVDAPWVRARLEDPAIRILDVRSVQERRNGYVPGSRLVLWQDLYADLGTLRLKSASDVKALLVSAGFTPGQQVVTYCAIGMRASLMYFAARYAGVPARVYVGSWQDWSRQPGYPIARGGA